MFNKRYKRDKNTLKNISNKKYYFKTFTMYIKPKIILKIN